jgi:hypothetical protein
MASMTDVAGFITAEMLKNARSEITKSIAKYTDEGAFADRLLQRNAALESLGGQQEALGSQGGNQEELW